MRDSRLVELFQQDVFMMLIQSPAGASVMATADAWGLHRTDLRKVIDSFSLRVWCAGRHSALHLLEEIPVSEAMIRDALMLPYMVPRFSSLLRKHGFSEGESQAVLGTLLAKPCKYFAFGDCAIRESGASAF